MVASGTEKCEATMVENQPMVASGTENGDQTISDLSTTSTTENLETAGTPVHNMRVSVGARGRKVIWAHLNARR